MNWNSVILPFFCKLKGETNLFKNSAQVLNGVDSDLSTSPMLCAVTICNDVWNIIAPYCAFILFEFWLWQPGVYKMQSVGIRSLLSILYRVLVRGIFWNEVGWNIILKRLGHSRGNTKESIHFLWHTSWNGWYHTKSHCCSRILQKDIQSNCDHISLNND